MIAFPEVQKIAVEFTCRADALCALQAYKLANRGHIYGLRNHTLIIAATNFAWMLEYVQKNKFEHVFKRVLPTPGLPPKGQKSVRRKNTPPSFFKSPRPTQNKHLH